MAMDGLPEIKETTAASPILDFSCVKLRSENLNKNLQKFNIFKKYFL